MGEFLPCNSILVAGRRYSFAAATSSLATIEEFEVLRDGSERVIWLSASGKIDIQRLIHSAKAKQSVNAPR